jgi:F-type H+-transporting ATPase subunit b
MDIISSLLHDPTFVVAISFVLFIGIIIKLGVPGMIGAALDERANKIAKTLDDARILREEAQALLAKFQRKQRDAQKEAEEMVAYSIEEARLFAKEAEANLVASIERQKKSAEEKISQAEANAIKEIRTAAIDVAIGAAQQILADELGAKKAESLVSGAIKDLNKQLH